MLKWLLPERQGITAVGKDKEKREPLCTVSEIVNCASTMKNIMRFGNGMHILLYLKQLTNKDLLYSTENSAQYTSIT